MTTDTADLQSGENHPAAHDAFRWVKAKLMEDPHDALLLQEAFSSTAISGDRTAELCSGTLSRILAGKPVGERYLLGLAWTIRDMDDNKFTIGDITFAIPENLDKFHVFSGTNSNVTPQQICDEINKSLGIAANAGNALPEKVYAPFVAGCHGCNNPEGF